jgi:Pyridoxamine 5'-phosphate oxidase
MPRRLREDEVAELLALDSPARLATLDQHGFPRITPLWFIWAEDAFWMTSIDNRLHLRDLARNAQAGLLIDTESTAARDGWRANRQLQARGIADTFPETDGFWTRRITRKYVGGRAGDAQAAARAAHSRRVICLRPTRIVALGDP